MLRAPDRPAPPSRSQCAWRGPTRRTARTALTPHPSPPSATRLSLPSITLAASEHTLAGGMNLHAHRGRLTPAAHIRVEALMEGT